MHTKCTATLGTMPPSGKKNTPAARHGGLDDRRMNQPGGMEAKRCRPDGTRQGATKERAALRRVAATSAKGRRSEARTETAP